MIYPDLFRQRGGRFNQNLSDVRGTTNFSHWDRNLPLSKFSFFMKKENWSRIHHPGIHLWVSLTDSESKHVASDTERASVVCPHTLPSPPSQIMTPPPPHIAILRRHPPSPHTRTNISQNSIHPSQPIHLPQITLILMNWYDTHTQIPIISAHLCSGTISSTEMKISGKNSVRW